MWLSRHQTAGQNHNLMIIHPFNMWPCSYIWEQYQNCIHDEIKTKLKSGNACYHSVQRLCLLDFPPKI